MVYFYEIIFIVLSYIALHKDKNHNLKSASFYFNVKKKEHLYNSNNIFETPLGIAVSLQQI